jgi:hypothetical protein
MHSDVILQYSQESQLGFRSERLHFPLCLLLAGATLTMHGLAQTAKVTFYSDAIEAKDALRIGLVPAGNEPFPGWLYDGSDKLAHFLPGHFVTFHLQPGIHAFSASGSSKRPSSGVPQGNSHRPSSVLHLEIERGENYCVRLSAKYVNWAVIPMQTYEPRIEQVPCNEEINEAKNTKPLDKKRIEKSAQDDIDPSLVFPKEQQ